MKRIISVFIRSLQAKKDVKRTLNIFGQWKQEIARLPACSPIGKKLLLIRLDDIGDYLLFRNFLPAYRLGARWQGYEITLLGFSLWKELFEYNDAPYVDKVVWINKQELLGNETYRKQLWLQLRKEGYEVVICPSRIRPLLLDDIFMLAAGAKLNIASENDFAHPECNIASDKGYQELFRHTGLGHEFFFNQAFANWCCGTSFSLSRPVFPYPALAAPHGGPYIICFIGASLKSRRWTTEKWIEFINLYKKNNKLRVVIAGGKKDAGIAAEIIAATSVENITGKVSLIEMANWMANTMATVTNDTMASHLSIALAKPTVMVCSGDNFYKFSAYKEAGINGVISVFPPVFLKKWKKRHFKMFKNYVAVTNDISTISAESVLDALYNVIQEKGTVAE